MNQKILDTLEDNEIHIEWRDCSTVSAICHDQVKRRLNNHLAVKTKNAADDLVKLGVIDPYTRFYDPYNQIALRGHVGMIIDFCKENRLKLLTGGILRSIMYNHPKYDSEFVRSLVVAKKGEQVHLRDYQLSMVDWSLKNRMGIAISATGSGKTMALYAMCRYLINEKPSTKILIVVPSITLVDQGYNDFIEYSQLDADWKAEDHCERLRGGVVPTYEKPILFATWQSLKGNRKEFYEGFNHLMIDEVHGADANVLKNIVLKCNRAYTKIGMTGSLKGTGKNINTESEMSLMGLFGRIETFSTAPMLMELGVLPKLKMVLLRVIYPPNVKKFLKENSEVERNKAMDRQDHLKLYREEQNFVLGIKERKHMISQLVDGLTGSGVVFFNSIERMHETEKYYFEDFKGRKKTASIYGGTKVEDRKVILYDKLERKDEEHQLFSTFRTTSTGISVDNIRYGIMGDSNKARVTVLQSIGRMLRGDEAIVIDIEDDIDNRKGFLSRHAKERKELYQSLGYPFEEKTLVLEVNSIGGLDVHQL